MKISEIKANQNNPRVIKDEAFEKLCKSIKEFPKMMSLRPIVIDDNNIILGGNMRLRAIQHLGMKEIPDDWVRKASELTEEEKHRFIIADNVGFGDWEYNLLLQDWTKDELSDWGVDVQEFEIEQIEAKEDDYEIPEEIKTDIVIGDFFQIGDHRLMCGDSTDSNAVAKLMNCEKADMVFTDPPYGVSYVGGTKDCLTIKNDDLTPNELKIKITEWFNIVDLFCRDGAYLLATVPAAGQLFLLFANDWNERGWLRQMLVWNKDTLVLGHGEYHYKHEPILFGWKNGERLKCRDRKKTTVWDFKRPKVSKEHPTMKPVEMLAYGIKNHSKENDLIYEPFTGSGTTMVAAHQLKRKCYGMEIDPKYCQVIIDRMKKLDPNIVIKKL